jgi:DNA-binding CsgD family transcriptional regulator
MQSVTQLCDGVLMISVEKEGAFASDLSKAEREVIQLALRGLSNKTIAEVRRCSSRTVANQLASVYRKLSVSGRRELHVRAATP